MPASASSARPAPPAPPAESPAAASRWLASARLVAVLTLASRLLGLARDMAMAAFFGAGMVLDAFVLAFTLPNLFRRLFGEGALTTSFIPVFARSIEGEGREGARRLLSAVTTFLVLVLAAISLAGVAVCLGVRALGETAGRTELFLLLAAVLLPYVLFICLTALLSGALNTLGHFLLPALTPVLFNLAWLGALFALLPWVGDSPRARVLALSFALTAAGLLQVAILLPPLARRGYLPGPALDAAHPGIRRIARSMGPMLFGVAIFQLNVLCDRLIAWWLVPGEGALSVLYLGDRVMQFPLGVIGVAMGTAVYPLLARLAAGGAERAGEFKGVLDEAVAVTLFLAVPASLGIVLLREPLVALFFEHRHFDAAAGARTATVLACYSLGVWAACLSNLATRAFFSLDEVRTPVRLGALMVLLGLGLNLALVFPLAEAGLALSTAITQTVNAVALLVLLRVRLRERGAAGGGGGALAGAARVAALSAGMAVVVALALHALAGRSAAMRLFAPAAAGLAAYLLLARVAAPDLLARVYSRGRDRAGEAA